MTQQIQFDAERYCRSNAGRMGTWMNTDDVATMIADEIHALRNAVEKLQSEAEALRAMGHELGALKEAARPVVERWDEWKQWLKESDAELDDVSEKISFMGVSSAERGATVAQLDALAALAVEE